jgi:hypothetical protein
MVLPHPSVVIFSHPPPSIIRCLTREVVSLHPQYERKRERLIFKRGVACGEGHQPLSKIFPLSKHAYLRGFASSCCLERGTQGVRLRNTLDILRIDVESEP